MPTMWTERLCSVKGRPFPTPVVGGGEGMEEVSTRKAEAVTEGFHSPLLQLGVQWSN